MDVLYEPRYDWRSHLCLNLLLINETQPSYFVRVPSYFKALWYPHFYFDGKSNI